MDYEMDYETDIEMDKCEKESTLRILIKKSKAFQETYPNLKLDDLSYSKEENLALNNFYKTKEQLYNQIKEEVEIDYALATLKRRAEIEMYRRLKLSFAKNYWENDDVISVVSDQDLMSLLTLIKRIDLK